MSAAIASVVIPAHDEAKVLRRCLTTLLAEAEVGEFEVVVIANGCTDRTADVAREFAESGVTCIEQTEPSKSIALRNGDLAAKVLPRIYLDADVTIDTAAARALVASLEIPGVEAAAPQMRIDMTDTSMLASEYLRVWEALPVFRSGYVGSGCYALSEAGRGRFGEFPEIIADDRFVDNLFESAEKRTLCEVDLKVTPPRNLRNIVRRSVRVKAGTRQLDRARDRTTPDVLPKTTSASSSVSTRTHLIRTCRKPREIPAVALFCAVQVLVTVLVRVREQRGTNLQWLRDTSSREVGSSAPTSNVTDR